MKNRETLKLLLMPALCALLGGLLLLAVSLIPESAVHDNAARSAEQMDGMGQWVVLLDEEDPACSLDSYTDQQIIMESYTLSASDPSSVLLNPRVWLDGENQSGALARAVSGQAYNNNYFRYWMGFRILYRPLLAVTSYFGILKIMAIAVFTALFGAGAYIGKRLGMAQALCFGAALALVSPATVMVSLQYSMCFLLAAVFIMLTLKREKSGEGAASLFCFFGAVTQFFDFYTAPLLTFGLPVLVLLSLDGDGQRRWRTVLKTLTAWLYGYAAMWLIKLLAVTAFTGENGFADGFHSLAGRVGLIKVDGLEEMYGIGAALKTVWWVSAPGESEKELFILLALLTVGGALLILRRKGIKELLSCGAFLAVAAVPILWFCCAAQPTRIHAWFQYRSIAVSYAGIFLFAIQGTRKDNKESICKNDTL